MSTAPAGPPCRWCGEAVSLVSDWWVTGDGSPVCRPVVECRYEHYRKEMPDVDPKTIRGHDSFCFCDSPKVHIPDFAEIR